MKNEIDVGHFRLSVDATRNEENMIEKIKALWIKYEEIIAYPVSYTHLYDGLRPDHIFRGDHEGGLCAGDRSGHWHDDTVSGRDVYKRQG